MKPNVHLTAAEARRIRSMLIDYQDLVEGAINSLIVPGTNAANPHDKREVELLAICRRNFKAAERYTDIIDGRLSR